MRKRMVVIIGLIVLGVIGFAGAKGMEVKGHRAETCDACPYCGDEGYLIGWEEIEIRKYTVSCPVQIIETWMPRFYFGCERGHLWECWKDAD